MQSMAQELLNIGITESADGTNIHDMGYYELRHLLTLERLKNGRDVDVENSENEWF